MTSHPTGYTVERVREMGSIQLWCELGLHKGFLSDETKYTNQGTDTQKDYYFRYFYLGRDDVVGVCDTYSRRAMQSSLFVTKHWHRELGAMNPNDPWQGPELSPRLSVVAGNRMKELVGPVLEMLQGGLRKPTLKLKPKLTQQRILFEDRPDVGRTLLYHPESECYMVETDPDLVNAALDGGCVDVTGVETHERLWAAAQNAAKPKGKFKIKKRPFKLKGKS